MFILSSIWKKVFSLEYSKNIQSSYLGLEFGKTWSNISHPALEFSGFLLGLLSLHIVSVDTGLQLSKLIVKAKTCQGNTPQTQNQEDRLQTL